MVIDRATVRRLLPYEVCIPLMRQAMSALSAGRTQLLLRQIIDLGDRAAFGVMPGAAPETFGAKLISVRPAPSGQGAQSHQGFVALFDPADGAPIAVLHAGEITAIRTAAASAAATDALARPEATRVAILGAGEQAHTHAVAMTHVRPVSDITIWARDSHRAEALAETLRAELAIPVAVAPTVQAAVARADIICTTTAASEPILESAWVPDGAHINLVGSSRAGPREIDDALVLRARLIADHRDGVINQGAEFLHAKAAGLIDDAHIAAEIGEVFLVAREGRRTPDEVTIYKSLGSIVQDLAAGWHVYQAAKREDAGTSAAF